MNLCSTLGISDRVIQERLSIIYYKLWFIRNKDCPLLSSVDNTQPDPSVGEEELAR